MMYFLIGMAILIVGGLFYGKYCDKVFGIENKSTPAVNRADGVDYVPMKRWKNSLIQLLNIAGTGPILGPIQGILFGPIAFILIPIGNVIGGAMHDYFCGMISIREDGAQMPALIKKYLGNGTYRVYNVFLCLLMLLVGAVFIYTPGDLFVTQVLSQDGSGSNPIVWIVYGVIFLYYIIATLFPIDKIIGKVYPIFGAILLLSAIGVGVGVFVNGYELTAILPASENLIPMFFVTVACGIVSGFHSTQSTLIARSVTHEKQGKMTFYNMMILEGFIAMIWAAAALGIYNSGISSDLFGTPAVVGLVAKDLLGIVGGFIAIIGVIILPITSGDTALRSLRLMIADQFKIEQKSVKNRVILSSIIFALVLAILIFAKTSSDGFNILWRYFAWSNQTIAVFAFAMISIYLLKNSKNFWIAIIPGSFYCFIVSCYILNAKIGFGLNMTISYIIALVFSALYIFFVIKKGLKEKGLK